MPSSFSRKLPVECEGERWDTGFNLSFAVYSELEKFSPYYLHMLGGCKPSLLVLVMAQMYGNTFWKLFMWTYKGIAMCLHEVKCLILIWKHEVVKWKWIQPKFIDQNFKFLEQTNILPLGFTKHLITKWFITFLCYCCEISISFSIAKVAYKTIPECN